MNTVNFMRENVHMPTVTTGSKVAAFFCGLAFGLFMLGGVLAFWLFILHTALQEADLRAAKAVVIGISKMDARCLEWQERSGGWYCAKR